MWSERKEGEQELSSFPADLLDPSFRRRRQTPLKYHFNFRRGQPAQIENPIWEEDRVCRIETDDRIGSAVRLSPFDFALFEGPTIDCVSESKIDRAR